MSVATVFRDHRIAAGFASKQALAEHLSYTDEYIRQIERGLKVPSDAFVQKFIQAIGLQGTAAEVFQQLVIETRIRRRHGANIKDFVGAEEVADRVCRDARVVLVEEIGVPEEDADYFVTGLRQSIISELR